MIYFLKYRHSVSRRTTVIEGFTDRIRRDNRADELATLGTVVVCNCSARFRLNHVSPQDRVRN